ncbi:formyltransferase family protein, partial [Streptomyces sp. NPDC005180]|uniref:formyltransferase family protein n=1 Tax=Streptomyces sp. NPDC005180 TaxID=3156868 RepID=UPI0033A2001E
MDALHALATHTDVLELSHDAACAPIRRGRARAAEGPHPPGLCRDRIQFGHQCRPRYDRIIGPALIDATETIVNVHPGRLPQYRGARPVNWALHNEETTAGITIHVIDEGIDSGPVLAEALFSVWPHIDEVTDVWDRAMRHGRLLISGALPRLGQITPRPQDDALAVTHSLRENDRLGD